MAESEPPTPSSIEQVLCLVDRQIEAVLRHGVLAVESDVTLHERPAATAMLRQLPLGIWAAVVLQVSKRGRRTVVRTRFMTTAGNFTLVSAWAVGSDNRPWIVRITATRADPSPSAARAFRREASVPST